jgi:ubiquitin C-terminal hydrolase
MPELTEKIIECPLYLDITPYRSSNNISKKKKRRRSNNSESASHNGYDLFGAIIHSGGGVKSGHYTCYTRYNEKWYYINNTKVSSEFTAHLVQ